MIRLSNDGAQLLRGSDAGVQIGWKGESAHRSDALLNRVQ
jgi:hypothetical protein